MDADALRRKLSELRDLLARKKQISENTRLVAERARSDDNCTIHERARLTSVHNRALAAERGHADSISTYEKLLQEMLEKTAEMLVDDNSQLPTALPTAQRIAAGP